ncbi:MAG: hypothetical protein AAF412_11675, partial [Pseudomonadota bacterium]
GTRPENEKLKMQLYYSDGTQCRKIEALEDIAKIKRNPRLGYDFIAVRGEFWPNYVKNLKYPG